MRFEAEKTLQRGVRAIAFIAVYRGLFFADDFASFLVEYAAGDLHGSDFGVEETLLLGASGALLAEEGVFVLSFAANFVALGDDFGGVAHDHVDAGHFFEQEGMRIIVAGEHGDAFHAAADGGVYSFVDDLVSGDGDRLQAAGAETIDGGAGYAGGEAGEHGGGAADVLALRAVGLAAAEDYVFDF